MSAYVGDFLHENYGDVRDYGVAGADVATRLGFLNAYLEHVIQLASVAPSTGAGSASYLEGSYAALANAAWAWSSGFGYSAVPFDQMEDYVSAQVDAMRSYDASLGWSADRIGFAWDPSNSLGLSSSDFAAQTSALAGRLAAAIAASADPGAPGAGACGSPWCTASVDGAGFTPAWSTFSSWTPTAAGFASAPQTVVAGSATGPMSLQLQIGSVVTALPVDTPATLSSSSPGGSFSTSPFGPWSPTLQLTVPAGSTSATFYMLDTQPGTPTVTASVGGTSSTQLEVVTAPAAPLALAGGGNTVAYVQGGAPVLVDPALAVSDSQSGSLVSATVAISAGLDPGDTLAAATAATGISASYANGALSLTGSASLAAYQAVLDGVTFSGTTTSGGSRTVLWTTTDGVTTASAVSTILYTAVPGAPEGVSAGAGNGQATVTFALPTSDDGTPITGYTVTSSPGGIQATGGGSPIVVSGLANGTTYTFTVIATNAARAGPASAPSNPVTPTAGGGVTGSGGSGGDLASTSTTGFAASPLPPQPAIATPASPQPAAAAPAPVRAGGGAASVTVNVSGLHAVVLGGHHPRLSLTVHASTATPLVVSLLSRNGKTLATWRTRLRAGAQHLSFVLPPKARHAGRVRLRLAWGHRSKTLTLVIARH